MSLSKIYCILEKALHNLIPHMTMKLMKGVHPWSTQDNMHPRIPTWSSKDIQDSFDIARLTAVSVIMWVQPWLPFPPHLSPWNLKDLAITCETEVLTVCWCYFFRLIKLISKVVLYVTSTSVYSTIIMYYISTQLSLLNLICSKYVAPFKAIFYCFT